MASWQIGQMSARTRVSDLGAQAEAQEESKSIRVKREISTLAPGNQRLCRGALLPLTVCRPPDRANFLFEVGARVSGAA